MKILKIWVLTQGTIIKFKKGKKCKNLALNPGVIIQILTPEFFFFAHGLISKHFGVCPRGHCARDYGIFPMEMVMVVIRVYTGKKILHTNSFSNADFYFK